MPPADLTDPSALASAIDPPRLPPMERRRKNRNAAAEDPRCVVHGVPDDLLWQILLRLDSPVWLLRAASACKRWRRVVTGGGDEGRAFLRLASSLHTPTVVGQYHNQDRGDIRFLPSSSSPIDGSRRFSVDFLDKNLWWYVADCHGGLVLLRANVGPYPPVANLIVYNPLTHQHRPIPRRPPLPNKQVYRTAETFLLDGDDGNISISNFRVLYRLDNTAVVTDDPQACVFSTANGGEWDWRYLSRKLEDDDILRHYYAYLAGRADGSLYLGFTIPGGGFCNTIVALDNTSLVFSRVDLPTRLLDKESFSSSTFTLVHGTAGVVGPNSPPRSSIVHVRGEELELFRQVHGSSGGAWVLEHSIPNLTAVARRRGLSSCLEEKDTEWRTMAGVIADGSAFAILSACALPKSLDSYFNRSWTFFSFDVNTMELRALPQELYRHDTWQIFNYTLPWPQFLRACSYAVLLE